ncbi:hypothetical protein BDK51DRAFT_47946 [Blyttiomyces helicus]|uniref:Uncharacterized protein n=1 Tax=Blyttiomyces helicus TaxID=388810 RepID=A0A4P9W7L5_9FUNG|nr:hypothetical protein BDK51DRAFT_47946 [Blyttiomyces helicus]|eukprot:RKO88471.1 hypothetical protein BDK51DRAFT_47946 [Blyttiomyces helicus]
MPTGSRGSNVGHGSSRPHNDGTWLIKAEILRVDKEVKGEGQPGPGDRFAEVLYYIRSFLAEKVHAPSGCLEHITMLGPYPSYNGPFEHAPLMPKAVNMTPAGRAPVPRPTTQYQPVAPFALPAPAVAPPAAAPPAASLAPPPVSHPRTTTAPASHSIPQTNASSHMAPAPHRPYSRAPAPPTSGFSSKADEKGRNGFCERYIAMAMEQNPPIHIRRSGIGDLVNFRKFKWEKAENEDASSPAHVPPPAVPAAMEKGSPHVPAADAPVPAADGPVPAEDAPVPAVGTPVPAPTQPAAALPAEPPNKLAIRFSFPVSALSKPDAASSSVSGSQTARDPVVEPAPRRGSAYRKGFATTERDIKKDLKEDSRKDVESAHNGTMKKQRPSGMSEEGEKKGRERAKAEAKAARDEKSKKVSISVLSTERDGASGRKLSVSSSASKMTESSTRSRQKASSEDDYSSSSSSVDERPTAKKQKSTENGKAATKASSSTSAKPKTGSISERRRSSQKVVYTDSETSEGEVQRPKKKLAAAAKANPGLPELIKPPRSDQRTRSSDSSTSSSSSLSDTSDSDNAREKIPAARSRKTSLASKSSARPAERADRSAASTASSDDSDAHVGNSRRLVQGRKVDNKDKKTDATPADRPKSAASRSAPEADDPRKATRKRARDDDPPSKATSTGGHGRDPKRGREELSDIDSADERPAADAAAHRAKRKRDGLAPCPQKDGGSTRREREIQRKRAKDRAEPKDGRSLRVHDRAIARTERRTETGSANASPTGPVGVEPGQAWLVVVGGPQAVESAADEYPGCQALWENPALKPRKGRWDQ